MKIFFISAIDQKLWGDKVESNRCFASACAIAVMLLGALVGGGNALHELLDWNTQMDLGINLGCVVLLWGFTVVESIIAATDWKIALYRSLLMAGLFGVLFGLGWLLSIVVLIIIGLILAGIALFLVLKVMASGGGSGKSSYAELEDGTKVKRVSNLLGTEKTYRDKEGHTYHDVGGGFVRRDD